MIVAAVNRVQRVQYTGYSFGRSETSSSRLASSYDAKLVNNRISKLKLLQASGQRETREPQKYSQKRSSCLVLQTLRRISRQMEQCVRQEKTTHARDEERKERG